MDAADWFLTTGATAGTVNVMLQNSSGTFTAKPVTGVSGSQCKVADVNGDGKADFVCVAPGPTDSHADPLGPATLTIALGNGDGTFALKAPVNLAGDEGDAYVLVSDLNHDGKFDIVTASSDGYGDSYIQAFLNAGRGNFTAGPSYSGGVVGGTIFGAADFNGDGFPDIVIDNNFEVQILTGKGDGSFTAGATYNIFALAVGIGDFNKDGHQDLVVVTQQNGTILLGQGNGTFTTGATLNTEFNFNVASGQTAQYNQPVPVEVYVGDLNYDGKLDIALTSASDTLSVAVYTGNGNGTFSNPKAFNIGDDFGGGGALPQLYKSISAFADFNNDGKIDVISASLEAGYVLAQGDGSGGFKAPVISQTPNAGSVAKGDFNGDGIEDVAVVNEPLCTTCTATSVTVFLGTGKNYFQAPVTYSVPVSKAMIAAGDINNDGHIDLVVARNPQLIGLGATSTDDVAVLLGRGDGTFESAVGYHLLGAPKPGTNNQQVYLEDVNKDGKLDLIGDWGVALGKGNGQFGTPIALPSSITGIVGLAPGDFNNTGNIGLAVATNTYDSSLNSYSLPAYVYVLAGSSNGSFHIMSTTSLSAYVSALATADMNGDHRTDILYTTDNYKDPSPQVTLTVGLSSTGNYGFTSKSYVLPLGYANDFDNGNIITGDFNRDGNTDVAIPALYQSAGDLAVLLGSGGGSLNGTPQYYQGSMGQAVVLDVNGDGAEDIVGTTGIGVARILNTGAH